MPARVQAARLATPAWSQTRRRRGCIVVPCQRVTDVGDYRRGGGRVQPGLTHLVLGEHHVQYPAPADVRPLAPPVAQHLFAAHPASERASASSGKPVERSVLVDAGGEGRRRPPSATAGRRHGAERVRRCPGPACTNRPALGNRWFAFSTLCHRASGFGNRWFAFFTPYAHIVDQWVSRAVGPPASTEGRVPTSPRPSCLRRTRPGGIHDRARGCFHHYFRGQLVVHRPE